MLKTQQLPLVNLFLSLFLSVLIGNDDTQLWSGVSIEKKLSPSTSFEYEQELRLKDQFSTFSQTFSEISFSYDIFDGLDIKIPYKFTVFEDKIKQRLGIGISYKHGFNALSIKYRAKYQQTFEKDDSSEKLFRNKLSFQYKINKNFESFISAELFNQSRLGMNILIENRYALGLNIKLLRKKSLKLFYIKKIEDLQKSISEETNIIGLSYQIKLS